MKSRLVIQIVALVATLIVLYFLWGWTYGAFSPGGLAQRFFFECVEKPWLLWGRLVLFEILAASLFGTQIYFAKMTAGTKYFCFAVVAAGLYLAAFCCYCRWAGDFAGPGGHNPLGAYRAYYWDYPRRTVAEHVSYWLFYPCLRIDQFMRDSHQNMLVQNAMSPNGENAGMPLLMVSVIGALFLSN